MEQHQLFTKIDHIWLRRTLSTPGSAPSIALYLWLLCKRSKIEFGISFSVSMKKISRSLLLAESTGRNALTNLKKSGLVSATSLPGKRSQIVLLKPVTLEGEQK